MLTQPKLDAMAGETTAYTMAIFRIEHDSVGTITIDAYRFYSCGSRLYIVAGVNHGAACRIDHFGSVDRMNGGEVFV